MADVRLLLTPGIRAPSPGASSSSTISAVGRPAPLSTLFLPVDGPPCSLKKKLPNNKSLLENTRTIIHGGGGGGATSACPVEATTARQAKRTLPLRTPPPCDRAAAPVDGDDTLAVTLSALEGTHRHLLVQLAALMHKVQCFPDEARLAALALLARFIAASPNEVQCGPKGQSSILAGVMSLAMKYAMHDVSLGDLVMESGLAAEAQIRPSDVVFAELRILAAVAAGVRVPATWAASVAIADLFALSLPVQPIGSYPVDAADAWLAQHGPHHVAATRAEKGPQPPRPQHQRAVCKVLRHLVTVALERLLLQGNVRAHVSELLPLALTVAIGLVTAEDAAPLAGIQPQKLSAASTSIKQALLGTLDATLLS